MSDDREDYDLSESLSRFRGAGTYIGEGLAHLYYGSRRKVTDQHPVVQLGITGILWFGGNWAYNRVRTSVFEAIVAVVNAVPAEFLVSPVFGLGGAMAVPVWVQALGVLSGVVIAQNRTHTRKLKRIEGTISTMDEDPVIAADGGIREANGTGGGGVGGAIAGGFAGVSFGPGGALAGAFLGYIIGENVTDSSVEFDSLRSDERT